MTTQAYVEDGVGKTVSTLIPVYDWEGDERIAEITIHVGGKLRIEVVRMDEARTGEVELIVT